MEQKRDEHELINSELDNIFNQLPWGQLNKAIINFSGLKKTVTAGGVRILEKNRKMIFPVIKRKCLENEELLHRFFASWFNEQKDYHTCLTPFFESKEHDELLKKRGRDDCEYVINDDYFTRFIDVVRPEDINKFLLLSPMYFTSTQKEKLEQLRNNQDDTKNVARPTPRSEPQHRKWADDVFLSKGEWKYHKNEVKKYQKVIEKLEKENSRLRILQKERSMAKADHAKQINEIEVAHITETEMIVDRQNVMQQKNANLEQETSRMTSLLTAKDNEICDLKKVASSLVEEKEKYFYQIIQRLDTADLISELNASNEVLELLNTVICPPTTENTKKTIDE